MSGTIIFQCPFCGSADNVVVDEIELGIIAICCDECKTIGPHDDGSHSLEDAIAKWNRAPRWPAEKVAA